MRDNYKIPYNDILKVVTDAIQFGCKPMIIINGEYYEIDTETIPHNEIKKDVDLPF